MGPPIRDMLIEPLRWAQLDIKELASLSHYASVARRPKAGGKGPGKPKRSMEFVTKGGGSVRGARSAWRAAKPLSRLTTLASVATKAK